MLSASVRNECFSVCLFDCLSGMAGTLCQNVLPHEDFLDVRGICWPRRGTLAKVCRLTSRFAIKACFVVSLPRLRTRSGRCRQFIQNQLFAFAAVLQTGR